MTAPVRVPLQLTPENERKRKVPVAQAAAILGISELTFRRQYKHLIEQVSPRRQAVTLGKVLRE